MAARNSLFENYRKAAAEGTVALLTDTIKAVLIDADLASPFVQIITAATNASPSVLTIAAHGFSNGDIVSIWGGIGNTAINGRYVVGGVTTNTFTLTDYDTGAAVNGNGAYTASSAYCMKLSGALTLNDIPVGARTSTTAAFSSKTTSDGVIGGVFDAADTLFAAVATGPANEAMAVFKDTGTPSTSPLIESIVSATGLPVTPNTGDINVQWSNTAGQRIFKL